MLRKNIQKGQLACVAFRLEEELNIRIPAETLVAVVNTALNLNAEEANAFSELFKQATMFSQSEEK